MKVNIVSYKKHLDILEKVVEGEVLDNVNNALTKGKEGEDHEISEPLNVIVVSWRFDGAECVVSRYSETDEV